MVLVSFILIWKHKNLDNWENLSIIMLLTWSFYLYMWINFSIASYWWHLYSSHCGSEADEIYKICSVIGSPTVSVWAEGLELASVINYQFPQVYLSLSYLFLLIQSNPPSIYEERGWSVLFGNVCWKEIIIFSVNNFGDCYLIILFVYPGNWFLIYDSSLITHSMYFIW